MSIAQLFGPRTRAWRRRGSMRCEGHVSRRLGRQERRSVQRVAAGTGRAVAHCWAGEAHGRTAIDDGVGHAVADRARHADPKHGATLACAHHLRPATAGHLTRKVDCGSGRAAKLPFRRSLEAAIAHRPDLAARAWVGDEAAAWRADLRLAVVVDLPQAWEQAADARLRQPVLSDDRGRVERDG